MTRIIFEFKNWPKEFKYVKKNILKGRFEDVVYYCIKEKVSYHDIIHLVEEAFMKVAEQRYPHDSAATKSKLLKMDYRKFRYLLKKHGLTK